MKKLKNIHPGEILKDEFLDPLNISVYRVSMETGLSQTRLSQIIKGKRSISAESALKLGKFFDMEPQFWMNLQNFYDLEEATEHFGKEVKKIHNAKELGLIAV
jgi:addiction module HigA family antidote